MSCEPVFCCPPPRRRHQTTYCCPAPCPKPKPKPTPKTQAFSGLVAPTLTSLVSFLSNTNTIGPVALVAPQSFTFGSTRTLQNLELNLLSAVPAGATLVAQLLKNGVAVPGFSITYSAGESGVRTAIAGPVTFLATDTYDLRITSSGTPFTSATLAVTATLGSKKDHKKSGSCGCGC